MEKLLLRSEYPNRLSPYSALLQNPYDEEAWYGIFSHRLRSKVCTVVIRQSYRIVEWQDRRTLDYRRECLAFC